MPSLLDNIAVAITTDVTVISTVDFATTDKSTDNIIVTMTVCTTQGCVTSNELWASTEGFNKA